MPPVSSPPPDNASLIGSVTASRGVFAPTSSITPATFSANTAGSELSIKASVSGDNGVSGVSPPPSNAPVSGSSTTSRGVPVVPPSAGGGSSVSGGVLSPPNKVPTVVISSSPGPAISEFSMMASPPSEMPDERADTTMSDTAEVTGSRGASALSSLVRSVSPSPTSSSVPLKPVAPPDSASVPTTGAMISDVRGLSWLSSPASVSPTLLKPEATPSVPSSSLYPSV